MVDVGRVNRLQVVRRVDAGLFLAAEDDAAILLPKRYIPRGAPVEVGDWLEVFVYLDSEDRLIATTETPKVQVGEFASLKVVDITPVGLFLDWGLPKDLLLPHSEEQRPLQVGDYCVVYVFLDARKGRITATARLDRYLDKTTPRYRVGQEVDLLLTGATELGFKAIINNQHWGLIHKNELFRFVRSGMRERGYIRELRPDGKISLSLQPLGQQASGSLAEQILSRLQAEGGVLAVSDKSAPELIARYFGVSKGNFKKAIGSLYKAGRIVIHDDRIELAGN
jgi:uncharacterized protein